MHYTTSESIIVSNTFHQWMASLLKIFVRNKTDISGDNWGDVLILYTVDRENFIVKKVMWDKSSKRFNFIKAESIVYIYKYKRTTLLINFMSFNFVKHWPIRNLFNNKIFPIYGMITYAKWNHCCEIIQKYNVPADGSDNTSSDARLRVPMEVTRIVFLQMHTQMNCPVLYPLQSWQRLLM